MEVVAGSIGLNVVVAGVGQIFTICVRIYEKYEAVKRYKEDCAKLVGFVQRVQIVLDSTRAAADLEDLRWKSSFEALYTSLREVEAIFDDCSKGGMIMSLIIADDMNMRLSAISQRLQLALSMIPIQKANVAEEKLVELKQLQNDLQRAQWSATRAAEEQAASLKRLADQSAVDASKSHQMLAEILTLLKSDACRQPAAQCRQPAAASGADPGGCGGVQPAAFGGVQHEQLESEREELRQYKAVLHSEKHYHEEHYLEHIIRLIDRLEAAESFEAPAPPPATTSTNPVGRIASRILSRKFTRTRSVSVPPHELMCPITLQLFRDPVLLVGSGYTYEREAINEWLSRGSVKDPATGVQLSNVTLAPNINIRKQAQDWLERNSWYKTVLQQDQQLLRMKSSKRLPAPNDSSSSSSSNGAESGSSGVDSSGSGDDSSGGSSSSSSGGSSSSSGRSDGSSSSGRSDGGSSSSSSSSGLQVQKLPSVREEEGASSLDTFASSDMRVFTVTCNSSSSSSSSTADRQQRKQSAMQVLQQVLRLNLGASAFAEAPAARTAAAAAAADTSADLDQQPSISPPPAAAAAAAGSGTPAAAAGSGTPAAAAAAGAGTPMFVSPGDPNTVGPLKPLVIDFGSCCIEAPSQTLSGNSSGSQGKLPKLPPVYELRSPTQQAKREAQQAYAAAVGREAAAAAAAGSSNPCTAVGWTSRGLTGPRPSSGPFAVTAAAAACAGDTFSSPFAVSSSRPAAAAAAAAVYERPAAAAAAAAATYERPAAAAAAAGVTYYEPESAFVRAAAESAIAAESAVLPPVLYGCGGSPCIILDQYSAPFSVVSSESG